MEHESTLTAKFLSGKVSADVESSEKVFLAETELVFLLSLSSEGTLDDARLTPVCLGGNEDGEEEGTVENVLENATSICNRTDGPSQGTAGCLPGADCPFITLRKPSKPEDARGRTHLWGISRGNCISATKEDGVEKEEEEGNIIKVAEELKKIILERFQEHDDGEKRGALDAKTTRFCPRVTACDGKYTCEWPGSSASAVEEEVFFPSSGDNFSSIKCPIVHLCPQSLNRTDESDSGSFDEGAGSQFLSSNESTPGLTNDPTRTLEELATLCQSGEENYDEYSSRTPLEVGEQSTTAKSGLGARPNGGNLGERSGLLFPPETEEKGHNTIERGENNHHAEKSLFPQCAGSDFKRCEPIPNGSCLVLIDQGGFLAARDERERCRCAGGFEFVLDASAAAAADGRTKGLAPGRCVALRPDEDDTKEEGEKGK